MMEFIKKNPELLKMVSPQLSQMMGGKNIDPEIMMKSMEKIMGIFDTLGRIKRFMFSWRGIFLLFLLLQFLMDYLKGNKKLIFNLYKIINIVNEKFREISIFLL